MMKADPGPRGLVMCVGLYSSGSTWLYNVVAELLKRAGKDITQLYADDISAIRPDWDRLSYLVIKTHMPSATLDFLAAFNRAPVIVTVREPCDAVASLMHRFGAGFDHALEMVEASAARILAACHDLHPIVLRYEDRFFDRDSTIRDLAALFGLNLDEGELQQVYQAFTREKIIRQIERLERDGTLKPDPDPSRSFDPITHWHPRHIGKVVVGQSAESLSLDQRSLVRDATSAFCRHFDYSAWHVTVGETIRFRSSSGGARFLQSGWGPLDPEFVWGIGKFSKLKLCLPVIGADAEPMFLRFEFRPFLAGGKLRHQRLAILINNKRVHKSALRSACVIDVTLPPDLLRSGTLLRVVFIHPDGAAPRDMMENPADTRDLSIALRSMALLQHTDKDAPDIKSL